MNRLEDDNARNLVAQRMGVKPNWDAIRYQTYCVLLASGKTRQQAEQALHEVDGFQVRASSLRADYTFYDGHVGRHLSTVYVSFDTNGRITDRWLIELTGVSDTNRVEIDCAVLKAAIRE